MVFYNERPCPIPIKQCINTRDTIRAVMWACLKLEYTIDRPGMNPRTIAERIDDKVMGDIAAMATEKFLNKNDIYVEFYDNIRVDSFQDPDPGWDIVVGDKARNWCSSYENPCSPPSEIPTISVKSSRIPRRKSLDFCLNNYDFKIFRKHNNIVDDLPSEIEVQIYYPFQQSLFRDGNVTIEQIRRCLKTNEGFEDIVNDLKILDRYGASFLTAFISKGDMLEISSDLRAENRESWVSHHAGYQKDMWNMPLRYGLSFHEFPEYIKEKY